MWFSGVKYTTCQAFFPKSFVHESTLPPFHPPTHMAISVSLRFHFIGCHWTIKVWCISACFWEHAQPTGLTCMATCLAAWRRGVSPELLHHILQQVLLDWVGEARNVNHRAVTFTEGEEQREMVALDTSGLNTVIYSGTPELAVAVAVHSPHRLAAWLTNWLAQCVNHSLIGCVRERREWEGL